MQLLATENVLNKPSFWQMNGGLILSTHGG
jgi:hypothetical protein